MAMFLEDCIVNPNPNPNLFLVYWSIGIRIRVRVWTFSLEHRKVDIVYGVDFTT